MVRTALRTLVTWHFPFENELITGVLYILRMMLLEKQEKDIETICLTLISISQYFLLLIE